MDDLEDVFRNSFCRKDLKGVYRLSHETDTAADLALEITRKINGTNKDDNLARPY